MKLFRVGFMLILLLVGLPLAAIPEGPRLQQPADVEKVMNSILSQHVEKHQLNEEIIRRSFKIYINQFDPERTYLLERESAPFFNMSDDDAKRVLDQYRHHDFSAYERLNTVIQQAINRARSYRETIDSKTLFSSYSEQADSWSQVPSKGASSFAQTIDELRSRQYQQMLRYVEAEKRRYGAAQVNARKDQLVDNYHKAVEIAENRYLLFNSEGKLLSKSEQNNFFYMHVLKALASSLDAHTSVFNSNEAYDMRVRLEKGFDGIGLVVKQNLDGFFVKRLLPGSPAERNGLIKPNDKIVLVNGQEVSNLPAQEVIQMLRGDEGSHVMLQLSRQDKLYDVKLTRELVVVNEGRVELDFETVDDGIIGLIKLHSFYQGKQGISSERDIRQAIEELDRQGNLRGLILDLRDNSGGFLTQAVKVAGLFITNGVVVISKYSDGEEHYYRDMDGKVSYKGPLIVLTSKQTASAAEIVAQALQDYGVAIVVGDEQTYGKGTIQSQTVTDNGGGSYFKVTVGKYYTVSGKTPQKHGVKADILVPGFAGSGQFLEEVVDYPKKDMIPASYQDRLDDIDPGLRPWYMRYYVPTLQQRDEKWAALLPELKKKSASRITTNERYQDFLKGDDTIWDSDILEFDDAGDPQMQEAVNIVKDMIMLESQASSTAMGEKSGQ